MKGKVISEEKKERELLEEKTTCTRSEGGKVKKSEPVFRIPQERGAKVKKKKKKKRTGKGETRKNL